MAPGGRREADPGVVKKDTFRARGLVAVGESGTSQQLQKEQGWVECHRAVARVPEMTGCAFGGDVTSGSQVL